MPAIEGALAHLDCEQRFAITAKESLRMRQTVLIASRDLQLLETRVMLVRYAGYQTLAAASVDAVVNVTDGQLPQLVVVDHTFSLPERELMRLQLARRIAECPLICLNEPLIMPEDFLAKLANHLAFTDGAARTNLHGASGEVEDEPSSPSRRRRDEKADSSDSPGDGHKYDLSCTYLG